ncbi:MAG: histidine phosphatase family protein [Cyclobacteriaceae bacterium]
MKKLLLCRHAKSSWDNPGLNDHQRPLAPRGLQDAPIMAERLLRKGFFPDHMISSDAMRAIETAKIFAQILGFELSKIQKTNDLYHADVNEILRVIQKTPESVQTLFLFGHNPGLTDFLEYLGEALDNLPTSGTFGFELTIDHWGDLSGEMARFWYYDFPKNKKN